MTCISQLRPEGFGHILDSMQNIMGRSGSFLVLEELNPPQCILLRWGDVVPWCWSTWNDQRVANTETIRSLVSNTRDKARVRSKHSFCKSATWLYLMGAPVYGPQCDALHQKVFGIDLRCILLNDLFSSSLMILVSFQLLLAIPFLMLLSAVASRSAQEQMPPGSHNFKCSYQIILGRCPIYGSPCPLSNVSF